MKANKVARIEKAIAAASANAGIGNKAIKAVATKSAKISKETAEKVTRWFDAKQLYRVFKSTDLTAYNLQGELTICAMRSGRVAQCDDKARGTSVALFKGAQGQAAIIGKEVEIDGEKGIQSGHFALSLKSKGFVKLFKSLADFAAMIGREGEKGEQYGKGFTGLRVLAGSKYSFVSDGKKVWRWEQNTCSRGAAFFAGTF